MHMDLTYFILPESLLKRKYELSIATISVVMPENDLQFISGIINVPVIVAMTTMRTFMRRKFVIYFIYNLFFLLILYKQ